MYHTSLRKILAEVVNCVPAHLRNDVTVTSAAISISEQDGVFKFVIPTDMKLSLSESRLLRESLETANRNLFIDTKEACCDHIFSDRNEFLTASHQHWNDPNYSLWANHSSAYLLKKYQNFFLEIQYRFIILNVEDILCSPNSTTFVCMPVYISDFAPQNYWFLWNNLK